MALDVETTLLEMKQDLAEIRGFLERQPALTVSEFATKARIGRSTVHRMIKRGELRKENGKIPFSYLKGFLS